MIEYSTGVRVIVHTANLIRIDFDNKTQGMWWQDFPRKVSKLDSLASVCSHLVFLRALAVVIMLPLICWCRRRHRRRHPHLSGS